MVVVSSCVFVLDCLHENVVSQLAASRAPPLRLRAVSGRALCARAFAQWLPLSASCHAASNRHPGARSAPGLTPEANCASRPCTLSFSAGQSHWNAPLIRRVLRDGDTPDYWNGLRRPPWLRLPRRAHPGPLQAKQPHWYLDTKVVHMCIKPYYAIVPV